MEINILTLFPEIITGPLNQSILKRAKEKNLVRYNIVNIRNFASGKHKQADDLPYGGGPGMVMKPEPVYHAVEAVRKPESTIILMTPAGHLFQQNTAVELSKKENLVFICGHYEGIDERIRTLLDPLCLSIGNYILTNGALAACVVVDAVVRLIPGVLGNEESPVNETFKDGLMEFPQYTRPRSFMGQNVPDVLISGNHQEIEKWRREQAEHKTREFQKPVTEDKGEKP